MAGTGEYIVSEHFFGGTAGSGARMLMTPYTAVVYHKGITPIFES
jgi:hypothetical protein